MALTLPNTDGSFLAFSANFSTRISAAPTTYGLTAAQATAYAALHSAYATALAACDPAVRNKPAVLTKNAALASCKTNVRLLASLVNGTASVTDAMKVQLGLNVRAIPQPIPAPSVAPAISVLNQTAWTVRISLVGESPSQAIGNKRTGPRRGKPAGVSGATVLSFVGATPPSDMSAWKFEGNTGLTTIDVAFPSTLPPGQRVWLTAFWFSNRKASGPACAPVAANLPGGTVTAIAA